MSIKYFEVAEAMRRVGNDVELYLELIDIFDQELPSSLERISQAIKSNDGHAIEESLHAIKGALGNVGAMPAFDMASALETAAREGRLQDLKQQYLLLAEAITKFRQEVEEAKTTGFKS